MKKKFLGLGILTAALTLATGMTAFAGQWQQDTNGWYYLRDDGQWQWCGWFTDPADNSVYYLDPDGYMMSATVVEGYKLGDDGRRIEKTEEDYQREKERKQRIASKSTPAKEQAAAELAAEAAKTGVTSVSNTRLAFQSEMKTFMDKHYIDALKDLHDISSENTTSTVVEDNIEVTYKYNSAAGNVCEASLWKMSNKKNASYKPEALVMSYNRSALSAEGDIAVFDELFNDMSIAALGQTEGQVVYDLYNTEFAAGTASFDRSGNTDAGNSYTLTYRNGKMTISVICADEYAQPTSSNTAETSEAAPAEETVTSSVIVAGQGQAVAEEEATEETVEAAVEETTEEAAE